MYKPVASIASKILCRSAAIALLTLAGLLPANAQELSLPEIGADGRVDAQQLQSVIRSLEAIESLDEPTQAAALAQLRDAESQLQNRLANEAKAAAYASAMRDAPQQTETLRIALERSQESNPADDDFGITGSTSLAELEQLLANETGQLATTQSNLGSLETQLKASERRPVEARARLVELQRNTDRLKTTLEAPPPPGEAQILTDARTFAARLAIVAKQAEISQLEQDLLSLPVRRKLLEAERNMAVQAARQRELRVNFLRSRINEQRQSAAVLARQETVAAEMAAADKHPVLREFVMENVRLAEELPTVVANIELANQDLSRIENAASSLEQRLAQSRQRLDIGGMSPVIGELLIEERRSLPQLSEHRSAVRARHRTLASIGLAQVRMLEERRALTPLDAAVEAGVEKIAADVSGPELDSLRAEIRQVLQDRSDLLQQADNTYRSYLQVLGSLDIAQRSLLVSATKYREFLDQNLMWIPSAPVLGTGTWKNAGKAFAWGLSPTSWHSTLKDLVASIQEHAGLSTFAALLLFFLFAARRPLTRRYRSDREKVGRLSTDHIGLTLTALLIAAFRATPLPLMLAFTGWLLNIASEPNGFSLVVANGLLSLAPFLYNVLLFRSLFTRGGVAEVHFSWKQKNLARIQYQLGHLALFGGLLVFATVLFYGSDSPTDRATAGRIAFISMMALLALVSHAIAHPDRGVAAEHYKSNPDANISRLRWLWYTLGVGMPLMLAGLATVGYLYTAAVLSKLLVDTIWMAFGMIVVGMIVIRWLALARRKIEWQIALDKRAAQLSEKTADTDDESSPGSEGDLPAPEIRPLDLDLVDQQTRRILQSGLFLIAVLALWGIWSEELPAFNMLDSVALWSKTVIVDGIQTIAPVTVADLMLGLVIAAVTFIASSNLPGLMELTVLQRLELQPGSRYAINTVVRYIVVTIGVIAILNVIGWDWSQIQWLVAALSVGLGFGLQEIVANFVSGLVILFERPVRVGDTVTVGELTGTVSRIRIRATTITDWDRKEIIVPNKSFITEQVVNWTLSDPITRIVIPVGISYGSDVELAHKVMTETLHALPLVLDEPPPNVYFTGFGESSLDFRLHVYSRQLTDRMPLMHAVHQSILGALRKHGIEIPFPQRDLHLRSSFESSDKRQDD